MLSEHLSEVETSTSVGHAEQLAFPLRVSCKQTDFAVALISKKAITLQDTHSQVSVDVLEGIEGSIWQKVHTNISVFQQVIADEKECMAGPVVELYIKSQNGETLSDNHRYRIRIPHCLKTEEQLSLVKVRCRNIHGNIPFEEIPRGIHANETGPYFEVDKNHIIIFTNHFSQFVCSTCSKACDCIMAFPFGSLILTEDNNMTTASVKVILCPSLYNIEDFWKVSRIPIKSTILTYYSFPSKNHFRQQLLQTIVFLLSLCAIFSHQLIIHLN